MIFNIKMLIFYGEELLALRPNSKLEDHPLPAVRDCIFNVFTATLNIGGRSFIPTLGLAMPWWQGPSFGSYSPYDQKMENGEFEASIITRSGSTYIIWQLVVILVPS
jgi:hypothetical protein